jgi:hypothetical protein
VRYPWANDYRGAATVVYGHTPTPNPEWVNNTICIDTGAVFGGPLTALRYPSWELVSVPAAREYYEPSRPLGPTTVDRPPDVLSLNDVTGRRVIDTGYGRVTILAEAAALEVMGRFAIAPGAAAVAAADHGAVLDVHCGRLPRIPGRGVRRLPPVRGRPGGPPGRPGRRAVHPHRPTGGRPWPTRSKRPRRPDGGSS